MHHVGLNDPAVQMTRKALEGIELPGVENLVMKTVP
jgi:hypothetical protein